ncbi:hypothetical protein Bca4012_042473 [Brassica carinata]
MVATLVLILDENGDIHDKDGHLRNAAANNPQAANAENVAVNDRAVAKENFQAARPRTYASICNSSPTFQRHNFELKPAYFTLVGRTPYHGLPHEHPMDHLERFEDLVSTIKANGVPEDYSLCKLFKYSFSGDASHLLNQLPPGSLTSRSGIKNAFI